MAELLVSAFAASAATAASAGGAAAAGAGIAGAAAGGVAAGAGALSGTLGTLSTVATVASMASAILGGVAGYRQSQMQSDVAELNAEGARLEAADKAVRIRREMVQKVGQARVAFAGSGLDISSGSEIEAGYGREADYEMSLARTGGAIGMASNRMQAAGYRARGVASLVDAAGKAGGAYVQNQISIARRG